MNLYIPLSDLFDTILKEGEADPKVILRSVSHFSRFELPFIEQVEYPLYKFCDNAHFYNSNDYNGTKRQH